jgi:phospholipase C
MKIRRILPGVVLAVTTIVCGNQGRPNASPTPRGVPRTPTKHLIVVVGENRSFDNVFATYTPPDATQKVWNLFSQGIIDQTGRLVPTFRSQRRIRRLIP